jgi:hypothetical protein
MLCDIVELTARENPERGQRWDCGGRVFTVIEVTEATVALALNYRPNVIEALQIYSKDHFKLWAAQALSLIREDHGG